MLDLTHNTLCSIIFNRYYITLYIINVHYLCEGVEGCKDAYDNRQSILT